MSAFIALCFSRSHSSGSAQTRKNHARAENPRRQEQCQWWRGVSAFSVVSRFRVVSESFGNTALSTIVSQRPTWFLSFSLFCCSSSCCCCCAAYLRPWCSDYHRTAATVIVTVITTPSSCSLGMEVDEADDSLVEIEPTLSIEHLPPELILYIFRFLDGPSLFAYVSRHVSNAERSTPKERYCVCE